MISAAFIGPGTVTTAVAAGVQYQLNLLWAVSFATVGCFVLQEVSARITIASGISFGDTLIKKFGSSRGKQLQWLIGGAVILGCAAYEAGNILGAVSGMALMTGINSALLTIIICLAAAFILWWGGKQWIANIMTLLVLLMGIAFATLAAYQDVSPDAILKAAFVPTVPIGSEMILLGLVGTTIVPYNIFIGSGISKGQTIPLMRIGLAISILIGGLITAAILIAGVSISDFSSFEMLYQSIRTQVGTWGGVALALGLFAAGFSSAITSPYAASVVSSTVFGHQSKIAHRGIWLSVLLIGFAFGISQVKPIPVILAVQAINGLILPLVAGYLIIIVNDRDLIPEKYGHPWWYNLILLLTFAITLLLGLNNIDRTIATLWHTLPHLTAMIAIATLTTGWMSWVLLRKKNKSNE